MIKTIIAKFRNLIDRERVVKLLRENIKLLEEQNTSLQNTVCHSVDLVSNYKQSMMQMREYMQAIAQMHMEEQEQDSFRSKSDNNEEEEIDPYELIRKKTTIH